MEQLPGDGGDGRSTGLAGHRQSAGTVRRRPTQSSFGIPAIHCRRFGHPRSVDCPEEPNLPRFGQLRVEDAGIGCAEPSSPGSSPHKQRRAVAKPLEYFAERYADRDEAIAAAYRTGAYTMQAIADRFGVGRMTVSRAVKRFELHAIDDGKWETLYLSVVVSYRSMMAWDKVMLRETFSLELAGQM
jgi:hypothetical protein